MKYTIEDLLHTAADMQIFDHEKDSLDYIVEQYCSDELCEEELDIVAAAGISTSLSYQQFLKKNHLPGKGK